MSKISLISSAEYIEHQQFLIDVHSNAMVGLITLSVEWCWRRDLANQANRRMFDLILDCQKRGPLLCD